MPILKLNPYFVKKAITSKKEALLKQTSVLNAGGGSCNTFFANCCGCCPGSCAQTIQQCCNPDNSFKGAFPTSVTVTITPIASVACASFGGSIVCNLDPGQDCSGFITFSGTGSMGGTCNDVDVVVIITICEFIAVSVTDSTNLYNICIEYNRLGGLSYLNWPVVPNPSAINPCQGVTVSGEYDADNHQDNCTCIFTDDARGGDYRHCYIDVTITF